MMTTLNVKDMNKQYLSLPTLPEQESIGQLFRTLDDLISAYKKNLEHYQNLKTSMLSKMFPKEGQKQPEIRLDGFDGDWEERELGEITQITMGQSPNSENYASNPNDNILVQGNADIKNGRVYPRVWTTQVTKTAKVNDIIFSVRAPVGDIAITDYDVVIGRGVASIKGSKFIFYSLKQLKLRGYWNKLSTGSTFDSINSNDLKSTKIPLPSLPEQEAIGAFFTLSLIHI